MGAFGKAPEKTGGGRRGAKGRPMGGDGKEGKRRGAHSPGGRRFYAGLHWPEPVHSSEPPVSDSLLIEPREHDLGGGFRVRRALPAVARRAVGPFVFFDHFGPVVERPEDNHDVRPHPHIGLATVTYLFEGAMMHRDSTGVVQRIEPGAVNWMTAGRGIVHSERAPDDLRGTTRTLHGLQLWVAVPESREEDEPGFQHVPADAIPTVGLAGASVRVLAGAAYGAVSPVRPASPTLYLDIALDAGASLALPAGEGARAERAVYGVDRPFTLDGTPVPARTMAVVASGAPGRVEAVEGARLVVVGGDALGERHMYWNFVSSRRERIVQACDDWAAQRIGQVPGETEFIPLPEKRWADTPPKTLT
jgi:redox-sensitive bicupin YhaK (pirin superfamily)